MAAITVKRASQTTLQSHTSASYAAISGAAISSSDLEAGKKYLILATAQVGGGNGHFRYVRLVHGSTAFEESEQIDTGQDGLYHCYQFLAVWEAVADEGLALEFRTGAGGTVTVDQVELIAIKLSDDLTENTDWYFSERANDDSLSTTPANGASVTFTPAATGNWLVLTYAQIAHGDTTTQAISQLARSGEASSSTPEARCEGGSVTPTAQLGYLLSRVFALTAASNTFTEISAASTGTAHTRLHSTVFALRLGAFDQSFNAYTEADVALDTSAFGTQLQTASITPNATGDFVVGAYWGFDGANISRTANWRLQVAGSDAPATQTSDAYPFRMKDNADERPLALITVATLNDGASRSITLDGAVSSTTSSPTGQHRSLWGFSVELASGAEQLPPTITADTEDEAPFDTPTPALLFTGTDPNDDDLRYQIQITDNPDEFAGGEVVTSAVETGSGSAIHPNPTGGLTWESHRQVDDRPGMAFQGHGGVLDSIDFYFGPHESEPEATDGHYLVHIYLAAGTPIHPVPDAWQATTAYEEDDIVRPTSTANANVHFAYRCKVGGTTSSSEPDWPGNGVAWKSVADGEEVEDGTATWETVVPLHPVNPADPANTPTSDWIAISEVYPYSPGEADLGWKTLEFTGENRIRLQNDQWYIAILDWRPSDTTIENAITVRHAGLANATAPGNVYLDGASSNNNGPRIIDDAWFRVRESYVLIDAVSGTDPGFANEDDSGDSDPFTSGEQVSYTVQEADALADGTYFWRVRAIDPDGTDTWSDWTEVQSFTVVTGFRKVVSGVLFASGAVTRQTSRLLDRMLAPAGTLIRQVATALAGAFPLAGTLTRRTDKPAAGSLSPSGALASALIFVAALTGSLAPAGALARQTGKMASGSLSPAGTLIRQIAKTFAGTLAAAGALTSQLLEDGGELFEQSVAGTLALSGTVARQTGKLASGALTPAGALVRQVSTALSGAWQGAGTLTRQTATALAGSLTPAGALDALRTFLAQLAGSLALAGTLGRRPNKAVAGALAPAGTITRGIAKRLAGMLAPVGALLRSWSGQASTKVDVTLSDSAVTTIALSDQTR